MLNAYLQVRSGDCDDFCIDGCDKVKYLMRPDDRDDKGSTQIDIICGDGKVQLSRREHITVQKLDDVALLEPDEDKAERWSLLMLLSRQGPSLDWNLHFSVTRIGGDGVGLLGPCR